MIITLLSEAHSNTVYAIRTGDKDATRKAKAWEAECWEAAMIVRRYQQRVRVRQELGITAAQRLDALREDIALYSEYNRHWSDDPRHYGQIEY